MTTKYPVRLCFSERLRDTRSDHKTENRIDEEPEDEGKQSKADPDLSFELGIWCPLPLIRPPPCGRWGLIIQPGHTTIRGGSRRGSLGGGTVILGLFLVYVKPIFLEVKGGTCPLAPPPGSAADHTLGSQRQTL